MTEQYQTIDGYSFLGQMYQRSAADFEREKASNFVMRMWRKFYTYWTKETRAVIACLVITGVVTGLIAIAVEFCVNFLLWLRTVTTESIGSKRWELEILVWISWSILFCLIAGCCPAFISKQANGSGIPEMKTIISGIEMPQYLSFRCLVSKLIGLTVGQGAELYIGRVGSFVHVGAMVCNQILKLPFLEKLRNNYHLRMQMLSAACSLGPAAVYGAPVGGVFFSIEVTSTFFYVHSLWKGILCAVSAKMVHAYFRGTSRFLPGKTFSAIYSVQFGLHPFTPSEFIILILSGVVIAFIGASFSVLTKRYVMFRSRYPWWKNSFWGQLLVAGTLIGLLSYPTTDYTFGQFDSFRNLVSTNQMAASGESDVEIILSMLAVGIMKFTLVIVCGTLPIPGGLFAPTVLLGAHFGRLIGEIVDFTFPHWKVVPAGYALIGMTAFPCAVTSTFSPAIITVEAIGNLDYLVPCLFVSVISYSIGEFVNHSIYNVMIRFRKLPYLSANLSPKFTGRLAQEVMETDWKLIPFKSTVGDIKRAYEFSSPEQTAFPIIDNNDRMFLIGAAQRSHIEKMLAKYGDKEDLPIRLAYRYQLTRASVTHYRVFTGEEELDVQVGGVDTSVKKKEPPADTKKWCASCFDIKFDPDVIYNEEDVELEEVKTGEDKTERTYMSGTYDPPVVGLDQGTTSEEDEEPKETVEIDEPKSNNLSSPKSRKSKVKLVTMEDELPWLEFDPAPYQTPTHTPLVKIQFVFCMLMLTQVFITYKGKLVGVITKKKLLANPERTTIAFGG